MLETFVALLTAHLVADFVLQQDWMVAKKSKPAVLLLHGAIVGLCAAAALGARDLNAWMALAMVVGTHLAIDFVKVRVGDSMRSFVLDQLAHILVILLIVLAWPGLAGQGAWALLPGNAQANYYAGLALVSGLTAAVFLGGILIKKAIQPFAPTATPPPPAASAPPPPAGGSPANTLLSAGRYIGWLERALIFAFILTKMPEGVGFLLAAKSVLRIGDLKDADDRSNAEYIIVGTFMSFGWAFLVASATQLAVAHWLS